jgi:hypothetical protein
LGPVWRSLNHLGPWPLTDAAVSVLPSRLVL